MSLLSMQMSINYNVDVHRNSFNKYYCVKGSVLVTENTVENKIGQGHALLMFQCDEIDNKQIHM